MASNWFADNPPSAPRPGISSPQALGQAPPQAQGGQGDPKSIALAYAQSLGPPTDENIQKTADYMRSLGYDVKPNPGSDGFWLNGQGWDIVQGYKTGNPKWQQPLIDGASGGGAAGGDGGGYGFAANGLTPTQQIEQTPGYQFSVDQAMNAIQHSAAAHGTLLSGGLMKNLGSYIANSVAGPAYQSQIKNLYDVAGLGQNAAALSGNAGANYGRSASDLLTGIGNAQAGATAAGGSGYANAVTGAGNTAAQIWAYQHPQDPYGSRDPFQANASGYAANGVNQTGVNYVQPRG
jgi:hypothetical protein